MLRRSFLLRCSTLIAGSAVAGMVTIPTSGLFAVGLSVRAAAQMTKGDRTLLQLLSAYSTDAYFWGSQVFARATGIRAAGVTTNLLVRVGDYGKLVAFFRSRPGQTLGTIRVVGNTISFTFQGMGYNVTNEDPEGFSRAVAGGGVTRERTAIIGVFAHDTMLYHPGTDTLADPHLAAAGRRLDLVEMPTGGPASEMRTLLQGWLEARQQDLEFAGSFQQFQDHLLDGEPTAKTAPDFVKAFLDRLPELAGAYSVPELGSLLLTPLVSASLEQVLRVNAAEAVAQAKAWRAATSSDEYPDAAIWIAALLPSQLHAGTAGEWLDLATGDHTTDAATHAAIGLAGALVGNVGADAR